MSRNLLIIVLLLSLSPRLPAPPAALPEAMDRWIDELGDPKKRTEASKNLSASGLRALGPLRNAARNHPAPQVRIQANALYRKIERDFKLVIGNEKGYWLNRVAFLPGDRKALATGGGVILYDLDTGKEVRRVLELNFARCGLALSSDGKHFVTGHQFDKVLRMGEVETGKVVRTFTGHTAGVYAVALSPDGKLVASGSNDKTLRLWNADTGKEIRQFPGITDMVRAVAFDPKGSRIVSGHYGPDSTFLVRLWDVEAGKELRSLRGHAAEVTAVLLTPDGKSVLSASMDGTAILWDAQTGKEVRRLGHAKGIRGMALSADGKRVLTAGFGDRCVRLWDLESGKELKCFEGHAGAVLDVCFASDGRRAISCDSQCTLRLWDLPAK